MRGRYRYEDLERHFIAPAVISPFYPDNLKLPRKLKKRVKKFCWVHWEGFENGARLWYYMEKSNPDYKRFLIKLMCQRQPEYTGMHARFPSS